MAGKKKRRLKPLRYRVVRKTKKGRPVEVARTKFSSAKGGIAKWLVRNKVSDRVKSNRPDRHAVGFRLLYRYRIKGDRRTYTGALDVEPHSPHFRKRFKAGELQRFRGTKAMRKSLNRGAWDVYRTAVTDLILGNRAGLATGSGGRELRKRRFKGRVYAKLELALEVERVRRPAKGKK